MEPGYGPDVSVVVIRTNGGAEVYGVYGADFLTQEGVNLGAWAQELQAAVRRTRPEAVVEVSRTRVSNYIPVIQAATRPPGSEGLARGGRFA